MKASNIQELFGTLQQSVVTSWRKHLKSSNHAEHVILNDFYDDMLDAVDELIESYMSQNGKVEGYKNLLDKTKEMTPIDYLNELREMCKSGKDLLGGESEIESLMDDVVNVIDTALYKLKELVKESNSFMDLSDYINESLNKLNKNNISIQDLKKAYYSDSFMDNGSYVNIDGETYSKIKQDEWEHESTGAHTLSSTYNSDEILDLIKKSKKIDLTNIIFK